MSLESLRDLFVEELKDIYNAEKQLLKALPKMAKRADSPELKQAFREHTDVTELFPRVFDLIDRCHVRHRTSGTEVGQDHTLRWFSQDVGRLGHEVHAAKDNVLSVGLRCHD